MDCAHLPIDLMQPMVVNSVGPSFVGSFADDDGDDFGDDVADDVVKVAVAEVKAQRYVFAAVNAQIVAVVDDRPVVVKLYVVAPLAAVVGFLVYSHYSVLELSRVYSERLLQNLLVEWTGCL